MSLERGRHAQGEFGSATWKVAALQHLERLSRQAASSSSRSAYLIPTSFLICAIDSDPYIVTAT